jgi:hypothetical protein
LKWLISCKTSTEHFPYPYTTTRKCFKIKREENNFNTKV